MRRPMLLAALTVSLFGIFYAVMWILQAASLSAGPNYTPERAQHNVSIGYGLLASSALVAVGTAVALIRKKRP